MKTGERMTKKFNTTGTCIPGKHYMADTSPKLAKIIAMIDEGEYFSINKPRQYGKTTIMYLLEQALNKRDDYLAIKISFESIDSQTFSRQFTFIRTFLDILKERFRFLERNNLAIFIENHLPRIRSMSNLARVISQLIKTIGLKTVLMIDEVDKSANNQLFIDFLGMLREKYIDRSEGRDVAFHAVVLAGVHDVKTLKTRIRPDGEKKFNSPWNIAVDFKVDLSFSPVEISPMIEDYANENHIKIDMNRVAERIYYFTSGYPFLVSKLCKITAEEISPQEQKKEWDLMDIDQAVQTMIKEDNTNFGSLIKNLENNPELYDLVFKIIMNEMEFSFNMHNPVINEGVIYGVLKEEKGKARIHNRIYEQLLYNYMISKLETSGSINFNRYTFGDSYLTENGGLDIEKVIRKFQEFMKEQYSVKDNSFLERNGRLLFLAFLKPIINGRGFDFKEVQISEEKRIDVVITFGPRKYIIELKLWHGEQYHRKGIDQLCEYMEMQGENKGYLLIYDLRKESGLRGNTRFIEEKGKNIFIAWV